jgi:type IV secretory pathway VirB2 component (pilin)
MFVPSIRKRNLIAYGVGLLALALIITQPSFAYADLESSIRNVKNELATVVMPLVAVIGLLIASVSYMTGNPNAKQHVTWALLGAAISFGSQSIINFISSLVQ